MSDDALNPFEEWDDSFLIEVIDVAERATSSSADPTQLPPPPQPLGEVISYSPPRELSQRVPGDDPIKGFDPPFAGLVRNVSRALNVDGNDRLKRESGRVVKQHIAQEQVGQHIRKADKKKEPHKSSLPHNQLKVADGQGRFGKNLEHEARTRDFSQLTSGFQNIYSVNDQVASGTTVVTPTCKSIGVQTDKCESPAPLSAKNDISASHNLRRKLLAVLDSSAKHGSHRNLLSELLVACETDLGILFGCLSFGSRASSPVDQKPPAQSTEADKVFNLYSMFTKIGSEMVKLDAVLEALIDLCRLDNDVILYRSLRVLHKTLNHTYCLDVRSNKRDNVLVEGPSSRNSSAENHDFHFNEITDLYFTAFETGTSRASCLDWFSVFELMWQIATRNTEECIRLEAVSMMNMILIRTNAYVDRERFGRAVGFQSLSQLLREDSGVGVRKEAVHLLYLLLNCPQLMTTFCSGCKEEVESAEYVNYEETSGSAVKQYGAILEGLAGCVTCRGNSTLELKLRRDTVTLLAFLASSGKLGLEILLLKRSNYLPLILQMLVSEMDAEGSNISEPSDVFKERTFLIRETLIFLNRLVSNSQFSTPVLRVLTDSRDAAWLAVHVANRLSSKTKWCWQSDSMIRQMRESEIVDLARVFRRRVFTYLENTST